MRATRRGMSTGGNRDREGGRTVSDREEETEATAIIPAPAPRSAIQQAGVDEADRRRREKGLRAPFFVAEGRSVKPHPSEADDDVLDARISLTTGCSDPRAQVALLNQSAQVFCAAGGDVGEGANEAAALLNEIRPENALEALLATQMLATQRAAMTMLHRALLQEQPTDMVDRLVNRAVRLQRVFLEQTAALTKLRGQGGQRVTVEHVHRHVHVHGSAPAPGTRVARATATPLAEFESLAEASSAPDGAGEADPGEGSDVG